MTRWVCCAVNETPIAQAVRQILAANPQPAALKFVSVVRAAMNKIHQQPDQAVFQKIKLEAMLKIVKSNIVHGEQLLLCFGFVLADGTATLTHRVCDFGALLADLNHTIEAAGLVEA